MGSGRTYKYDTQERIINLLANYRSLPMAVREMGGRPCERTVRYWLASGLPRDKWFLEEYRKYHGYWELFRIGRGMQWGIPGEEAKAIRLRFRDTENSLRSIGNIQIAETKKRRLTCQAVDRRN